MKLKEFNFISKQKYSFLLFQEETFSVVPSLYIAPENNGKDRICHIHIQFLFWGMQFSFKVNTNKHE